MSECTEIEKIQEIKNILKTIKIEEEQAQKEMEKKQEWANELNDKYQLSVSKHYEIEIDEVPFFLNQLVNKLRIQLCEKRGD